MYRSSVPLGAQQGFTLMEIVISTAIFASALTLILVLFTYTLKINRRVESLRQVSQATRNFTEFLVREIRNSTIDYTGTIDSVNCPALYNLYQDEAFNQNANFLALVNRAGDRECFFMTTDANGNSNLMLSKTSAIGIGSLEQVNPAGVTLDRTKLRFFVRPLTNPKPNSGTPPGIQPMVTILMYMTVQLNGADQPAVIPYQTTVSTDTYDLPHR